MINLILAFLIIEILSVFYSLKLKQSIAKTFILSIMSIIFILYIFGLLSLLKWGVYFIELLSVIALIYEIIYIVKNKKDIKKIKKYIFNTDNLIFTILFIILIFIHYGRMLSSWDEFSHWGDVVKAMFTINDFSTSPKSLSAFQSYPPAMSLFQYFWMKLGNNFIEYQLFISYQIVAISLFLPFISDIKKISGKIISVIILLFIPMIAFNNFYTSIYIDAILGLLYGYNILTIIFNKKYDCYFILNLFLSFFTLILLKDVGLFLVIINVLILFLDIFFIKKKIELSKIGIKNNRKYILILVGAILLIIFTKISWDYNIKLNNASIQFGTKISIKDIYNLLTLNNLGYKKTVIKNFIDALYQRQLITGILGFNTITLTIVLMLLINILMKKMPVIKKYSFYVFMGLGIYVFGLLFLYCTKFSEYEAIRLASFERYLSIYFLGIIFMITVLFINKLNKKTILLLLILLFIPYYNVFNIRVSVNNSIGIRSPYLEAENKIKNNIDEDDKIYIISQNTTGFDFWVLRYSLRPNIINSGCWSIGEKYYEGDIWTLKISSDEWMNNLIKDDFDYVYIYKSDQEFVKQFGELFNDDSKILNDSLFKVDKKRKKLKFVE